MEYAQGVASAVSDAARSLARAARSVLQDNEESVNRRNLLYLTIGAVCVSAAVGTARALRKRNQHVQARQLEAKARLPESDHAAVQPPAGIQTDEMREGSRLSSDDFDRFAAVHDMLWHAKRLATQSGRGLHVVVPSTQPEERASEDGGAALHATTSIPEGICSPAGKRRVALARSTSRGAPKSGGSGTTHLAVTLHGSPASPASRAATRLEESVTALLDSVVAAGLRRSSGGQHCNEAWTRQDLWRELGLP